MTNLALDTHRFVTDLKKAGMKTNQAEAVVSHISTALSDRLATKDDVKDMATKAYLDQALDLAIAKLWNKMLAALLAHAAIVVGAVIAAFFALA